MVFVEINKPKLGEMIYGKPWRLSIATKICRNTRKNVKFMSQYIRCYNFENITMRHKKLELKTIILDLLTEKNAINIQDIAKSSNLNLALSADRRRIQRNLSILIHEKIITPSGNARARVYVKRIKFEPIAILNLMVSEEESDFKISKTGKALLKYVTQPLIKRISVNYNDDFLKSYKPNKTFYLPLSLRQELIKIGTVENIIRPAGTYARAILNRLLIDLSWNSSRLEGNTYSLLETQRLIELGEISSGKEILEAQMILNHKAAIEYAIEMAEEKKITPHVVRSLHAILSEDLLGDPTASGRLRHIEVGIHGTRYRPLSNPYDIKEKFEEIIKKLNAIKDPYEQSFFALVHISYLQAFEDINKRTARLIANIPFIKNNLKPLSFVDVNTHDYIYALLGVYEKNDISLLRDLYVWAYKHSAMKYTAVQLAIGKPNAFKLKYREIIHDIIRYIILEKIQSDKVVKTIRDLIDALLIPEFDKIQLFQIIEVEVLNLNENNIARFKIRPSEYYQWKSIYL